MFGWHRTGDGAVVVARAFGLDFVGGWSHHGGRGGVLFDVWIVWQPALGLKNPNCTSTADLLGAQHPRVNGVKKYLGVLFLWGWGEYIVPNLDNLFVHL